MAARMSILLLRRNAKIEHVDDERSIGNSIIIVLKQGWTFTVGDDNRIDGADTLRDAYALLATAKPHAGPYWP